MTGSSSISLSNGSGAIISKSFGAVEYAEHVLNNYEKVLMEALNEKAQERQGEIRQAAHTSDTGWAGLANQIEVNYDHSSRNFTYTISGDEERQRTAMDLEYGNGHLAPTPLLRTTILQQQDKDAEDINKRLHQLLMGSF